MAPYLGMPVLVHDYGRAGFDGSIPNIGFITKVHSATLVNVKVLSDVSPIYDAEEISFCETNPQTGTGRYCYAQG